MNLRRCMSSPRSEVAPYHRCTRYRIVHLTANVSVGSRREGNRRENKGSAHVSSYLEICRDRRRLVVFGNARSATVKSHEIRRLAFAPNGKSVVAGDAGGRIAPRSGG